MARNGHAAVVALCLLSGPERTSRRWAAMSEPETQLGHGRAGLDFVAHRQIRKSTNCADPYRDSQRIGLQGRLAALHSALQHSIYSSRSLI